MTARIRPRIILVHGAWVGAWEFDPLVAILRERGWEVDAVDLPSTGSTGSMQGDAAAITAAIDRAAGPVVLVAHSYGGVPVTEAGDHPAVERIVYVAAFALDAGESVLSVMGGSLPGVWGISDHQLTMGRTREERVELIAADMPPGVPREASEQLADLFRPQSLASFGDQVSRVAWRAKPTTYLLTENDAVVEPAFQESLAVRSGAEIIRLPHGHAPFQEDPAGFAELLERLATLAPVAT
ncbi:alpha/beta hydrolase [Microbacterium sp. HD4P20]|uniref:alpha/beta hydrolase n=1 Tax=Microbacterium sp. HD4P20 TaxID=2864874 RepID=UPI001C63E14C|nr:alpha/beta hydrolase [Microbacterium sp. HD4P20]MCP2638454.1 alpha/beta hydrolase [Microbacterium sp. HD4P20]